MTNRESPLTTSRAEHHGLTCERLRQLIRYESHTGKFLRATARGGKPAGSEIGALDREGYRTIAVDGVLYKAHRLAWMYMTGSMPANGAPMDHINRVRDDNRWANLRVVTHRENIANQSRPGAFSRSPYSPERRWSTQTLSAVGLVRDGLSCPDAARQAGVTVATLRRACKKLGLIAPPAKAGAPVSPLTTRGIELIRAGRSLRETAALLGLAPSTLVRACQRAGMALPRGRRPG